MTTQAICSQIADRIKKLNLSQCIIAIDGKCASGKTTLADCLKKSFNCSVIHMDDFFLQPHQRTLQRLSEPGGNIDYERFVDEVVVPLKSKQNFHYRKFDCHTMSMADDVFVEQSEVVVVEGSYSCHPKFCDLYDIKVFLDIDSSEQLLRIEKRNGKEFLQQFVDKWIPLEEKYFDTFGIKDACDMVFNA